jgi:hypothetical protein
LTIYKGILAKLPEKKQVVLMAGKFNEEVEAFGRKHMFMPLVVGKCGSGTGTGEVGFNNTD